MQFSGGTIQKVNDITTEIVLLKDAEIDEKMVVEILDGILKLNNGEPHCLLYNFNDKNIILSELARKISGARNYNNANLIARAIFTQNMASNMESVFYINHDKPAAETKIFSEREKALEWLALKAQMFLHKN